MRRFVRIFSRAVSMRVPFPDSQSSHRRSSHAQQTITRHATAVAAAANTSTEPTAAMRSATGAPITTPSKNATATTSVPTMPERVADARGAGSGDSTTASYRHKTVRSRDPERR